MKTLKILIILSKEEEKTFKFSNYEGENVQSIALINHEDIEENILQLLECNLVVTYTIEQSGVSENTLRIARILNREIIHFSKLQNYVK
jgi:hypothetical protein